MKIKKYLLKAQKGKWAIGQFNISNFEELKAIFLAAEKLKSPVIVGTSEGESKFIGMPQVVALINSYRKNGFPIFLNLDHSRYFDYTGKAISEGYDLIHFDGSKLPLDENIKIAKKIVKYAHKKSILVEGEVGVIAGASKVFGKPPEMAAENLTDPNEAEQFIKETQTDSLAINIGTFHGMSINGKPRVNFQRLKEIKERTGNKFLVMHGGSGVSDKDVKKAIKLGIVKININTRLRIAYTKALKDEFKKNPNETTPYKYMPKAVQAVQKVVEEKIKLFGSVNKL